MLILVVTLHNPIHLLLSQDFIPETKFCNPELLLDEASFLNHDTSDSRRNSLLVHLHRRFRYPQVTDLILRTSMYDGLEVEYCRGLI